MNDIRVEFFLHGRQIALHRTPFPPAIGDLVEFVTGDSVDNTPVYRVVRRIFGYSTIQTDRVSIELEVFPTAID